MKTTVLKALSFLFLVFLSVNVASAQSKSNGGVCMFAYGTDFNDSTVYVTAISRVDGAMLDKKTNFLAYRQTFSQQMKNYLDRTYGGSHTCAVFFNSNRAKLEKVYAKMRRNAAKNKGEKFVEIPATDFTLRNATFAPSGE